MPGVSIQVVDVSRGVVAVGMKVELLACGSSGESHIVASGNIADNGTLQHAALSERLEPGFYEARFHVADYYRRAGIALPPVPFLDVAAYRFGLGDTRAHYHLPMKCTPWGYSCFRGGA